MYAGEDGFLAGTVPFLREGAEAGEPTLVVVDARRIDALRSELGSDAGAIRFADMAQVGANPARIIPAWRKFADAHAPGRSLRGIGEPIWAERSPDELIECQRHESLLNVAFADAPSFRLLCPYDVDALDESVVHEAECSHPHVVEGGAECGSSHYRGLDAIVAPFDEPLPEPRVRPERLFVRVETLSLARELVARYAVDAGIGDARAEDLVIAVNEVASNSVRHGGGEGTLLVWRDDDLLLCEIRDGGRIRDPMAGRQAPGLDQIGGHGLWLANQLCDLVQVRSSHDGTVVRLHTRIA